MAIDEYEAEGHARPKVVPTEHALRRDLIRVATLNRTLSDPARLARLGPASVVRLRSQLKVLEVRIASLRRGRSLCRIRAV
jgi:hypothetical protein